MKQPASPAEFASLGELLRFRAARQPQRAYTYLLDGETEEVALTYQELDAKARAIAVRLRAFMASPERILLLFPPGLEFIAGFFGCIYAGAVAVPAYPPEPGRLGRTLPLLTAIAHDAQPAAVLTTSRILATGQKLFADTPELQNLKWLTLDEAQNSAAAQWNPPATLARSVALLQYTSGSTGSPKGVMVTHGNLLHNSALIYRSFGLSNESRGVNWLPAHHDMGLIGGILQGLYAGCSVTLMSPVAFLIRPVRWLEAISRTRATTSGGPNFAYDLCARKITPEQRARLDLSSWQIAFNGSEPIRPETMERFSETFKSCGFRREAFYPCYGLAEATLFVSGGSTGPSRVRSGDHGKMKETFLLGGDGKNNVTAQATSCGVVAPDYDVIIVDPERRTKVPPGRVGEVWISGPSVALGYWNRPKETNEIFRARLADTGEGPFLRTGDLGFLQANELFITGRLKDLIIIGGRNHYAQDIEWTVEQSHPAVRSGCCAAFCVDDGRRERLVIAAELDHGLLTGGTPRAKENGTTPDVVRAIRQAVAEQHDLRTDHVLLLKTGSLPKTTSGKLRRYACRARFLDGSFDVLSEVQL